ncbi:replication initiation protein [Campylobacter sp. CNRCH_2014_2849]|uniref:replication initiation protein n=1 Tax=Campylobacter sp. CNRCH_2014_2849 TaxID=2911604 RepID=UPI0021E6D579|nr:replication initiation protein [Campylobacter sp. CNRCH_2014_2849]MCV3474383.1 replication initiation protein [Campylobacter sp. CNRCH_2014_2849]
MSDIVKYHNDFNKIQLPSFTEQEQNLLFLIFAKIKEKGIENEIQLYADDFKINERLSNSRDYLTDNINSLKYKFFKANFKQILETETEVIHRYVNLFETMEIHYVKRNPYDGYDTSTLFNRMALKINPDFSYLVNQLTTNFTSFELAEFVALSGKYTKTLYRLLKQYRTTGKAYFEWENFLRILEIPEKMRMCDIDKDILKPAIKELTAERTLFDQVRIPFKNLAFEKKKIKARGRGGKVVGIEFTFKPENIEIQKIENEAIENASDEEKILIICKNLCQSKIRFKYEEKIYQSNSFDFYDFTFNTVELQEDEFGNLLPHNTRIFKCDNKEQFLKMIKKFSKAIV